MANMKGLLVVATWVWWIVTVTPAWAVTFDVTESATTAGYSTSITSLRDQVKSKEVKFGIPVMKKSVPDSQRFILVDIKFGSNKTITLGIDVINLYVVAYRDTFQGKARAHFFPDAPPIAKSHLFKGATIVDIKYQSSYRGLEGAAKQTRRQIQLGISSLRFAILSIFGKQPIDQKLEAKFLIIVIQTISEASRFKYIENEVKRVGTQGSFIPDYKVLSLENNWQAISKAIQKSKNGNISPALELKDAVNKVWKVSKVKDIAPDMGLLKYEATLASISEAFYAGDTVAILELINSKIANSK